MCNLYTLAPWEVRRLIRQSTLIGRDFEEVMRGRNETLDVYPNIALGILAFDSKARAEVTLRVVGQAVDVGRALAAGDVPLRGRSSRSAGRGQPLAVDWRCLRACRPCATCPAHGPPNPQTKPPAGAPLAPRWCPPHIPPHGDPLTLPP